MKIVDRLTWHMARTPLVRPVKALRRASCRDEIATRQQLAASIAGNSEAALCAEHLNHEGYVDVTHLLAGPAISSVKAAASAKLARVAEAKAAQMTTQKSFWVRLLDEDMSDGLLRTDNPFVALALHPGLIQVLAETIGELPQLDYVLLTLSEGSDAPLTSSQLWHRDYDDVRTIKLFIYLSDVKDSMNGPFTFLPAPVSDKVGFTLRTHRPDEAVFKGPVRQTDVVEMTGQTGSAFLVETSRCLHMGSRLSEGYSRLLYTATFTTAPGLYSSSNRSFALSGNEDSVARMVLSRRAV